jgi:hypothetical protein
MTRTRRALPIAADDAMPILPPSQRRRTQGEETMKNASASQGQPASDLISQRIAELADWRGRTLARMRALIRAHCRWLESGGIPESARL